MYGIASLIYLLSTISLGKLNEVKLLFLQKPKITLSSGFVNGFSYVFLLFALKSIQVSIAEPIAMLSMPLSILIAKKEFNENQNWFGVVLMLLGSWLLFF